MGKKKKYLKKYGTKENKKYATRRDFLLSQFDDGILSYWFESEDDRVEFGDKLIKLDDLLKESEIDILSDDNEDSVYDKKRKKIEKRVCHSMDDIVMRYYDLSILDKKEKKLKKKCKKLGTTKDLCIISYLNGKNKYGKKFLNTDEYRKELKKLAKTEKSDEKVMRKLGYIKSKNVDDELRKIKEADKKMEIALSDSYSQKHFLK